MRWITFFVVACIALACTMAGMLSQSAFADFSRDDVMNAIAALSEDPRDFKKADAENVAAIEAMYEVLSDADQEYLDTATGGGQSQPYGRVLESAVWAIRSLEAPDNSTTLPDGVYDATTTPALSSSYSKGKSTSSRQRPWSVKSVRVEGGKAYATVTVESSTYPSMITGGKTYSNTASKGDATFEDVPIDLNNTFYFAGASSSMPRPIMFSLTTTIEEPEPVDDGSLDLEVTNGAGSFVVSSAVLEVEGSSQVLKIVVDGDDYRSLYPGAYPDALAATGDAAAWIAGEADEGSCSFAIPINPGTMLIPFTAQSSSHASEGAQASLHAGAFRLRTSDATLSVEPYDATFSLSVTDGAQNVTVGEAASVRVVGGQAPNDITAVLDFTLGDDMFTRVVYPTVINGVAADAEARLTASSNSLQLVLVNTAGASSFAFGKPMPVRFYLDFADAWVNCEATLDLTAKTLSFSGGVADADTVEKMIAALPVDPMAVAERHRGAIEMTESAYDALSAEDKASIDKKKVSGSLLLDRQLEQAVWALRSLDPVDNSTTLPDGVYTGKVASKCSLGKSDSARQYVFTVKQVTVKDGKAMALIEHDRTIPDYVLLGGKVYRHINTDENAKSQFEIPIDLNSTMYLSQMRKEPTPNTVGSIYALTTTADESSLKPDEEKSSSSSSSSSSASSSKGSKSESSSSSSTTKSSSTKSGTTKSSSSSSTTKSSGDNGNDSGDDDGGSGTPQDDSNQNGNTGTGIQSNGTTNDSGILARIAGGTTNNTGSGAAGATKSSGANSSSGSNSNSKTSVSRASTAASTRDVANAAKGAAGDAAGLFDIASASGESSPVSSAIVLVAGALLLLALGGFGFVFFFTRREYGFKPPWSWT